MYRKGISVILLTWNGLPLLKECLPKILENLETWKIPQELIIVDNGSEDGSRSYLKENFPHLKYLFLSKNLGFSKANNQAVKQARFDTLLFLNNDLYLEKGFIEPLYEAIQGQKVFAAAPKILRWDHETIDDGLRYGSYGSGFFTVQLKDDEAFINQNHWVTFFCGACFLCKRNLFEAFGGFDTLYTPYAWEDLDLSYRAWKRGYKIAYVPKAVAYHKREATTRGAFSHLFFISLMWRNQFIFTWKNLTSPKMFWNHIFLLPFKLIKFLFNGRWRYVIGFFRALPFLPEILKKRSLGKRVASLTDEEVLTQSFQLREKPIKIEIRRPVEVVT